MVVLDDSAVLERCLESARPHVSSFVICDAGSRDNTRSLASVMLSSRDGRVFNLDPDDSTDPVPSLYAMASEDARYVLFVHPDEVVRSIRWPMRAAPDDVLIVEVDYGRCAFKQPRLIRSGLAERAPHPFRVVGRVARGITVSTLDHLRLGKQVAREGATPVPGRRGWQVLLERRDPAARTAADCVELAVDCSRRGDLDGARSWLDAGLAACDDPQTEWQLRYLLGLSRLDGGDKTRAVEDFARAFELDPERLEPLHQLVRIKSSQGDLQSAVELSRLALDLEMPRSGGYLERIVYERERYIQHIVILERLQAYAEARDACDALLEAHHLRVDLRRFLEKSRKRYGSLAEPVSLDAAPWTTAREPPLLTVGMAVIDDYDGVYFTVMSLLSYHREHLGRIEFLVIDNNPDSASGAGIRRLCEKLAMRYIPLSDYRSTAVRDSVFRYARGRFVLCLDCHVLLLPGALCELVEYIERNPDTPDLLQGPLVTDTGDRLLTHLDGRWKDGMYGVWAQTEGVTKDTPPFEIPMQGLGLFCCRKDAWPGLNPRFAGFGGEEGYLHEKFRRAGAKVLCLPFLQWLHRFDRPSGIPYRISWQDRIRNYLVGHDELGWDPAEMAAHFARAVSFEEMSKAMSAFVRERSSPFFELDAIYFLDYASAPAITAEMSARFQELGISSRVRRIELGPSRDREKILTGVCSILDFSLAHGFDRVLVISSLDLLPGDLDHALADILEALRGRAWSSCFLGLENDPGTGLPMASGLRGLMRIHRDDGGSPVESIAAGATFLVNLASRASWIRAWSSKSGSPAENDEPADSGTAGNVYTAPACYAVCPPVTVPRDRFHTVSDPARYCSVREQSSRSY